MDQLSNNPPDMTVTAQETMRSLSDWLSQNPAITEASAKEAKVFLDRGKLCIKDLEDEREAKVKPLNSQVQQVNTYYREPRELLKRTLDELSARITRYIEEERARRETIAQEARRRAQEAEQASREAERIEQERLADAAAGELDVQTADLIENSNNAFREYERATRQAALAERETNVKIGGGFSRAIGLKEKITLELDDILDCIEETGITADIREACLKAARAFYRLNGRYPRGIIATSEAKI